MQKQGPAIGQKGVGAPREPIPFSNKNNFDKEYRKLTTKLNKAVTGQDDHLDESKSNLDAFAKRD